MPSVGIYQPPAARRLAKNVEHVETPAVPATFQPKTIPTALNTNFSSLPMGNTEEESKSNDKQKRQRRPDMAVYIPRRQRIAQEHQRKLEAMVINDEGLELQLSSPTFEDLDHSDSEKNIRLSSISIEEKHIVPQVEAVNHKTTECLLDTNNFKNETSHASEIPLKFVEISNNIECSDTKAQTSQALNHVQPPGQLTVKEERSLTKGKSQKQLNPEELDWDLLYDDSGECLDPTLLGQLTAAVGQVTIETPKCSYDEFKQPNQEDEFPNVVEIYNFPVEFKTPDLVMAFSEFKHVGFEIKWVDDTHALGVFNNAAIVADVLNMQHPFVKTRCLSEGTQKSKLKARRCADTLMPSTTRPDTCAALARRLVTGALGVKLPTQRAEREAERKILREAREKKRLAAKQREEAWEGTFS